MRNRSLILLTFTLLSLSTYSQNKSGLVEYYVHLKTESEKKTEKNDEGYKNFKRDIDELITSFKFTLSFNEEFSKFNMLKTLSIDKEDFNTKIALGAINANSTFYSDRTKNLLIEEKISFNESFLIKTKFENINWVLTKESKKIENYLCHKAIGSKEFLDRNGDIKELSLIAWYTEGIPYPYGPFQAVNLPGLVLEFHSGKVVYIVQRIHLKEEEDIKIELPNFSNAITQEEYNNLYKSKIDELSKMN